jgi:hypothetical protein
MSSVGSAAIYIHRFLRKITHEKQSHEFAHAAANHYFFYILKVQQQHHDHDTKVTESSMHTNLSAG